MKLFFLKLFGYKYLCSKTKKGDIHTIDCPKGKNVKNPKYLTENQMLDKLEEKDGCYYCMGEYSKDFPGIKKKPENLQKYEFE